LLHKVILERVEVMEGLSERRSWVGSSMNGLEGVSKVPLYGTKSSTLKVQLMPKFSERSIT